MPSVTRLARIARLATLPETRRLVRAAIASEELRVLARRARHDRSGLARDLRDPANARHVVRGAVRHPAVHEMADAAMLLLPGRYLPIGWAATWAARRILRRQIKP